MVDDNGTYSRRRIDTLIDDRFERIEETQDRTNAKLDALTARLNLIAGGFIILSIVTNLAAPFVISYLTGTPP